MSEVSEKSEKIKNPQARCGSSGGLLMYIYVCRCADLPQLPQQLRLR